ncbi:cytochrome c biogenesis protein ResB [Aquimarina sp. ERC-38]|uniref:cytochrome c biogenesis protein ResB n=1 Tax=Aquimarina sp. ERC-38 TaxID=2949996 RepID=UPI0022481DA8|nr:cytochrome c biogenesis protein ResB [Aquimarina sp. ERC-38]UZO81071.1 cytochrome c biogenesis protein ResB [Aquimarina sp. ERC-38]
MHRVVSILFSNRTSGLLLIVFAISMAVATFIENDFGTETAKALIYSAKWFEIVIVLLAINFAGNIAKYNLFSWKKAPIFIFHLAFIVIILGAGITKYRSFEGLMTIKEGESNDQIVSLENYLQVQIGNGSVNKNYVSEPLRMSELGFNSFEENIAFEDKNINIRLKKFIPRAVYQIDSLNEGLQHLHVVVANDGDRKDFYIPEGSRESIYGIPIAFKTDKQSKNDIQITDESEGWQAIFPEDTNYFSMVLNKADYYPKDSLVPLQFKALSEIKGNSIVFNTVVDNSKRSIVSVEKKSERKNQESAVLLEVQSEDKTEEITLFGGPGYMNPLTTLYLDDLHINLRYGSKAMNLPFALHLKDFILERYPGSESPSAFYSNLEIQEKNKLTDYTIFMNNVLDYKGYRFFQSAYLPDESGTILAVNKDYWGTLVSYLGYLLLGIGMLLSLFWRSSHFGFLFQLLNLRK